MCTASRREHDFRKMCLESWNDITRKCARRRGQSLNSESVIFLISRNEHGVEARARFSNTYFREVKWRYTKMYTALRPEPGFWECIFLRWTKMCTASRREHDFRQIYHERWNDVTRKCTRRRGESSISENCYFLMNSEWARGRSESTIFEKPILRRKMKLNEHVHVVKARARFLKRQIFRWT